MKILTIGGATKDLFLHYKYPESLLTCSDQDSVGILLEPGKKIEIETVKRHLGGGATNSAATFVKQDHEVAIVCKVGLDQSGHKILEELEAKGISTALVSKAANVASAVSFILPSCNGDNTLLVYRGANTHLTESDIPYEKLFGFDQLYISSLNNHAASLLESITSVAKKDGVKIAINPGMEQLCNNKEQMLSSLQYTDTFILNYCEALEFSKSFFNNDLNRIDFIKKYCRTILEQGPTVCVVTDGKNGVYAAHEDKLYFYPSIAEKVVSTVGAGDAFGSAFIANLLHGNSIEEALIKGVYNSASVLLYEGTQEGILSADELNKRYQNADKESLIVTDL